MGRGYHNADPLRGFLTWANGGNERQRSGGLDWGMDLQRQVDASQAPGNRDAMAVERAFRGGKVIDRDILPSIDGGRVNLARRKEMSKALAPPDYTDEIIKQVQRAERMRQKGGRTRQSTFRSVLGGGDEGAY